MRFPFFSRKQQDDNERKSLGASSIPWYSGLPDGYPLPICTEQAFGLVPVLAAIRLIAGGVAQMPTLVLSKDGRERAERSWQWELLHDGIGLETSPSALRADLAASLAAHGNAYCRKLKAGGRVRDLVVLDPRNVTPRRARNGVLVYDDASGAKSVTRGRGEIIHVRTFAFGGSLEGISPISTLRESLTTRSDLATAAKGPKAAPVRAGCQRCGGRESIAGPRGDV